MALTNYYVDPAGGSDTTGTGSSAAPWKTTQKALNSIAQGASGDQINIKAGSDDVLSATLSLATYGTPTRTRPLVFKGYTSAANDGGIGGISGNSGGFSILTSSAQGIWFVNMHLHHCGASLILSLTSAYTGAAGCEFDNSTSGLAVQASAAINCLFHDISGSQWFQGACAFCRFNGLVSVPSTGIVANGYANANEIYLSGSQSGSFVAISGNSSVTIISNNSIYGGAGSGTGISSTGQWASAINNIVEGFSGVGGVGFAGSQIGVSANNRAYNNSTNYNYGSALIGYQGTDYTDSASNFNSPSTGDLSLVTGSPAIAAAYPGTYLGSPTQTSYRDAGALQHQDAGGGGAILSRVFTDF